MQADQSKPRHGGLRRGAGRKPAYGEPTMLVRIPASQVAVVSRYLGGLKQPKGVTGESRPDVRPIASPRTATRVPALGRHVRAGKPTSGHDYQDDTVDLGRHLVRDPACTFLMKVDGWSMRDAGIADGDELVVDRDLAADDGRVVVAEVDGELTVKKLKRIKNGWLLQAANPEFADLRVRSTSEMHIWGVVTHVLHRP